MKSILSLDETPSALERSVKAAAKLKGKLPTDLEMESIPWNIFHLWLKTFILRQEKHNKILSLTCENS